MNLNIGCGTNPLEGAINIDIVDLKGVDLVCDASHLLEIKPEWRGKVETIVCFHMFEHFTYKEAMRALNQWSDLLQLGGRLIIELPNLEALCDMVTAGNEDPLTLAYIFGSQDRDGQEHRWGWTPGNLHRALRSSGFISVTTKEAIDYHAKERPCFRVEAIR